jgi:hypothetical protein
VGSSLLTTHRLRSTSVGGMGVFKVHHTQ